MSHHSISPSKLGYMEVCPGYESDQAGDTTAADKGTAAHLAVEKDNPSLATDLEYQDAARACIAYRDRFRKDAVEEHREIRLQILGGRTFGTCDELIIRENARHAEMMDWKFGREAVADASVNRQGFAYGIGVFEKFRSLESLRVHFILPRRDEITRHTFFRKDVPEMIAVTKRIIDRVEKYRGTKDASMLNRHATICARCGAIGNCPKYAEFALATGKKYEPLELAEEVHASQITDPTKMAGLFIQLKSLEKFVDSAKRHITEYAKANGGLNAPDGTPLFEVKEKSGARKISNNFAAYTIFKEYLSVEEIAACSSISLTDVLDMIKGKAARGQKGKLLGEVETKLYDANAITMGEPTRYLQAVKH